MPLTIFAKSSILVVWAIWFSCMIESSIMKVLNELVNYPLAKNFVHLFSTCVCYLIGYIKTFILKPLSSQRFHVDDRY